MDVVLQTFRALHVIGPKKMYLQKGLVGVGASVSSRVFIIPLIFHRNLHLKVLHRICFHYHRKSTSYAMEQLFWKS